MDVRVDAGEHVDARVPVVSLGSNFTMTEYNEIIDHEWSKSPSAQQTRQQSRSLADAHTDYQVMNDPETLVSMQTPEGCLELKVQDDMLGANADSYAIDWFPGESWTVHSNHCSGIAQKFVNCSTENVAPPTDIAEACRAQNEEQVQEFQSLQRQSPPDLTHDPEMIAAAMKDLKEGGGARDAALARLQGHVLKLTFDAAGCRLVQLAIEVGHLEVVAALVSELHGHVLQAGESPHGNYVMQKIVLCLPPLVSSFVAKELLQSISRMARHRFACRILCRLFEHCAGRDEMSAIVDELVHDMHDLCTHAFAHHVLQAVIERGIPLHKKQVVHALANTKRANAQNRNATYVIESAFKHCDAQDQRMLATCLFNGRLESTATWMQSQGGAHVVRSLMKVPGAHVQVALDAINKAAPLLQETKHGQRLLKELRISVPQVHGTNSSKDSAAAAAA